MIFIFTDKNGAGHEHRFFSHVINCTYGYEREQRAESREQTPNKIIVYEYLWRVRFDGQTSVWYARRAVQDECCCEITAVTTQQHQSVDVRMYVCHGVC